MSQTISTTITTGVALASGDQLIVLPAGAITTSGNAVYGSSFYGRYTVDNTGTIAASAGAGISLWGLNLTNAGFIGGTLGVDAKPPLSAGPQGTQNSYVIDNALTGTISATGIGVVTGVSVFNQGVIYGGSTGLSVHALFNPDAAYNGPIITNGGSIGGGQIGVALSGTGTLENSGIVSGSSIGVNVTYAFPGHARLQNLAAGTIEASIGVDLTRNSLNNAGLITGQSYGVVLTGGAMANNSGDIRSANIAVQLNPTGESYLFNSGTLYGAQTGLQDNYGTAVNSGLVTGAIGATVNDGTLINAGTIAGTSFGLSLGVGIIINQGLTSGDTGAAVSFKGTLLNEGSVAGGSIGVSLSGGFLIDSGTISGSRYAVYGRDETLALNPGAMLNGAVSATGFSVLALQGSGNGTLAGLGTSINGFSEIEFALGDQWTLAGNIAGLAAGQNVAGLFPGDTLLLTGFTATSHSFVSGEGLVLGASGASYATLSIGQGLAQYGNFATSGYTVTSGAAGTAVFIPSLGSIIGTTIGVPLHLGSGYFAAGVTVNAAGALLGNQPNFGNQLNFGLYDAQSHAGEQISNAGEIAGVWLLGATTLNNAGTITGNFEAIYSRNTLGVIENTGFIQGTAATGEGVRLVAGTLLNAGTLSGYYGAFIGFYGSLYNAGLIAGLSSGLSGTGRITENSGTIIGGKDGVRAGTLFSNSGLVSGGSVGVYSATGGDSESVTIINTGTLMGTSEALLDIREGPESNRSGLHLIAGAGAAFIGAVIDQGNAGGLTLAAGAPGALNIGDTFAGFSHIVFDTGATWTLEGAVSDLANGQTIIGIAAADTLVLDDFAAASGSFAAGTGLILSNASVSETLNIKGAFSSGDFALSTYAGATSIAITGGRGIISTISTYYGHAVTPGYGAYAAQLSITNTGTILTSGYTAALYIPTGVTGGVITNSGTIDFSRFLSNATLINDGTIAGSQAALFRQQGFLENAGMINELSAQTGSTPLQFYGASTFINTGTVLSGGSGASFDGNAYVLNEGTISGDFDALDLYGGGTVVNAGVLDGGIFAYSPITVIAEPGAVFNGSIGEGTLVLAGDTQGSLTLGPNQFFAGNSIVFGPGARWYLEGIQAGYDGAPGQTIYGFSAGDTLVMDGFTATSGTYVTGAGLELASSFFPETLDLAGNFSTDDFTLTNGNGNLTITTAAGAVACFVRGTRIATPRGNIAVEKLSVGDLVKTMHGDQPIRWIGRRAYAALFIAGNPDALPIRIRRHAIAPNIPSRDLYVSPDHAIAEGGVLIHAHLLQNGISIHQPERDTDVEYFHLEFDTHTLLFAENFSVESFIDEGAGNRFQNSHTRIPTLKPQTPCLPRVFDGFHLHNIKSRIAARAGIAAPTQLGALIGTIDEATPTLIRGWAQNSAAPEHPVTLEIISGGFSLTILANSYRPDLRAAKLGSGCHGFALPLPNLAGPITIRRVSDGATLHPCVTHHCRSA